MGMFDYVKCDDERVACAAGHKLKELQTKDFECDMDQFHVLDGRLFKWTRETSTTNEMTDDGIVTTTRRVALPDGFTGEIVAYEDCDECDPVVFDEVESHGISRWGIKTAQPWCEVALVFRDGALVEVRPITLETRDDVRAKAGPGHQALPDEDRVAAKTIAQARARRGS